jgi:polysaccharide deacetylase family protein (PEP-CTERM system associated)
MINALTIDVEDYFHVTAFERYVDRADWDVFPSRVVDNTLRILDMADEYGVKATFFVLGWVAERSPGLVKRIQAAGHEIACHGYAHGLIYRIGPKEFRNDVRLSKAILEDACGKKVEGYRAPSYSITAASRWALDILVEEGFRYDSSIFPIRHDIYGIPGAERFPHVIKTASGDIKEFPISTLEIGSVRLPVAGGGYLRLLPASLIKYAIKKINTSEGKPALIYFHPWEIDPGQPRIKAGLKSSFRHYTNLDKMAGKVRFLLEGIKFAPMGEIH